VDGGRIGKIAVVNPTDDDQHEMSRLVGRFGRSVIPRPTLNARLRVQVVKVPYEHP
jgi:hypothetical protein